MSSIDNWRVWREKQRDIRIKVKCWKCGIRYDTMIKDFEDTPFLWRFKLCPACEGSISYSGAFCGKG